VSTAFADFDHRWNRRWFWFCVGWAVVNAAVTVAFFVAFGRNAVLAAPAFALWAIAASIAAWRLRRKARARRAPQASANPTIWGDTAQHWKDMAAARNEILDDMPMVPGDVVYAYNPRHRIPSLDDHREQLSMTRGPFE
jgi:hypothetical protein